MFRVPWYEKAMGEKTDGFAELVDLYPTLAELARLPNPAPGEALEGSSLVSYFNQPDQPSVKQAAFSQYPRCPKNVSDPWKANSCHEVSYMSRT